ncbi:hypothetical protein H632_c2972p0 [Helicosporidium sp. ATCC 50920]|nr:hypothetical protein H632_c2972p0 [Helicosporidium sp. ATCC 50920]|eukprot:KDD72725.1 hypothetical protein H632_c2972p0 [Helicosporidium sp. ATCC 50920]
MDACLTGGGDQAQEERGAPSALPAPSAKAAPAASAAPASSTFSKPLAVPPKLVPSLSSERALRSLLRRYHLPTEGRKGELAERYARLRLEAQTANDRGEQATFAVLAQRVVAQERKRVAGRDGGGAIESLVRASEASGKSEKSAEGAGIKADGWTFAELVQATRERDAARRARRDAERAAQDAEGAGRKGEQLLPGATPACTDSSAEVAAADVAQDCPRSEDPARKMCEEGELDARVDVPCTQPCA